MPDAGPKSPVTHYFGLGQGADKSSARKMHNCIARDSSRGCGRARGAGDLAWARDFAAGRIPAAKIADNGSMFIEPKPSRRHIPVDLAPLVQERRKEERQPLTGSATAAFYEEDGGVCLTRVELLDVSRDGYGVRVSAPIAAGAGFVLNGPHVPGAQISGFVGSCTADGDGYRLGLVCSQPVAA
jgi:hypothetical protein